MKKLLLGVATLVLGLNAVNAQLPTDGFTYPVVDGYQVVSLWAQMDKLHNKPSQITANTRGMAVYQDKIYVTDRKGDPAIGSLLVFDAITGAFEREITLNGEVATAGYACNDIQVDDAGHLIVCSMTTNMSVTPFRVWIVDPVTGNGTEILNYSNVSDLNYRIDAFGVYGDMTQDGYILAGIAKTPDVGGNYVVRWNIVGGTYVPEGDGFAKYIEIKNYVPVQDPMTGNGDAPRVTPINDELFYLDGQTSYATMYDMDANVIESFLDESLKSLAPESGGGNNGVDEFSYNGDNFVVYVISNTAHGDYPQAWNICKLGDGMTFTGMQKMARVPEAGLGTTSNAVRTALPRIEVKDDGAYIYVFATNGGMAAYKLMVKPVGIGEESAAGGIAISVNGNKITLSETVADIEVYSVAGQKVATKANSNEISVAMGKGLYVVKAIAVDGTQKVQKVIIK